MKLIIDIPEEDYNYMMECCPDLTDLMNIYEQIKNSTPLDECEAEDCISRKQALKAICNICSIHQNGGKCSKCEQYNTLIDLPSVYPKSDRSVLEDIKAEIQNAPCHVYRTENGSVAVLSKGEIMDIIDNHISGKENNSAT